MKVCVGGCPMFVGLCMYVSLKGVSEACMSVTKRQNTPKLYNDFVHGLVRVF